MSKNSRRFNGPLSVALSRICGEGPERAVRSAAVNLLFTHRPSGPPFKPFEIARSLGVHVVWDRNIEADGVLVGWPNEEARILLRGPVDGRNGGMVRRAHFTLAHEIGHYVLREKLVGTVPVSLFEQESAEEEALCDQFASELLMPGFLICGEFKQRGVRPRVLLELCDRYDVSLKALLYRAMELFPPRLLMIIWRADVSGRIRPIWASPRSFRECLLVDTGHTTVERAFSSEDGEHEGRDDFLIQGLRQRWRSISMRLLGNKVLTIGLRPTKHLEFRQDAVVKKPELQVVEPLQLALAFDPPSGMKLLAAGPQTADRRRPSNSSGIPSRDQKEAHAAAERQRRRRSRIDSTRTEEARSDASRASRRLTPDLKVRAAASIIQ